MEWIDMPTRRRKKDGAMVSAAVPTEPTYVHTYTTCVAAAAAAAAVSQD